MNGLTYCQLTHSQVEVATDPTPVLAANPYRSYALFVNISDTDVWLACDGQDAVVQQAVFLSADGGNYEMTAGQGNLTSASVSAIQAGSLTKKLIVTEGV